MLVRYYVDIDRPLHDVERGLDASRSDLGAWAAAAYRVGEEVRAKIGLAVGPFSKTVQLEVGEAVRGSESLTYPVVWRATGATGLFPEMDAELILSPLGDDLTHVTFQGRYEPPLEGIGQMLDRAAMHRVAEATVRNLVERLIAGIREFTSDGAPG